MNALGHEHGYSPKGFHGTWANQWVFETIADYAAKGWDKTMFANEVTEDEVKRWVADALFWVGQFEKHFTTYNWKFLAGDHLTPSDFQLFAALNRIPFNPNCKH